MSIKKVLLLGDFSSLHLNLRDGLRQHGVTVNLASTGDGFKNYERDISLASDQKIKSKVRYIKAGLHLIKKSPCFFSNDVVQLIYPIVFQKISLSDFLLRKVLKKINGKMFYNVCGHDAINFQAYRAGLLGTLTCDVYKEILKDKDINGTNTLIQETPKMIKAHREILDAMDGVIANTYDYYLPAVKMYNEKLKAVIPFPIDLRNSTYQPNIVNGKIKIFYAINRGRENEKGAPIVLPALANVKKEYGNEIEIEIVESIPYKEYIHKLMNCNIFVDQVHSFVIGMAALKAMALGKIVLAGAKREVLKFNEVESLPYYNAAPNVDELTCTLKSVIEKRRHFEEIGYKARIYVEKKHDCVNVANEYINIWKI